MSAQHTPGPWEVVNCRNGYPRQIRSSDKSRLLMSGACYDVTRWNSLSMPLSAEGQANASLIAAAPELLAACKAALMLRQLGGMLPGVHEVVMAVVDSAQAAIAKATGEAA